jgi:hypothetical protein
MSFQRFTVGQLSDNGVSAVSRSRKQLASTYSFEKLTLVTKESA